MDPQFLAQQVAVAAAHLKDRFAAAKRTHRQEIDAILTGIRARRDGAQVAEIRKSLGIQ